MRVVLDTNLIVRAARPRASLARSILLESISDRHTLILSNSLYFEVYKVMYYERIRAAHGLDNAGIAEFLDALAESTVPIATHRIGPGPLIAADPQDDHVLLTAMAGHANLLGTNNRHFFTPDVQQVAAEHGIRIVRDVELIAELRKP
jgi:putative PIN family toxin of toxin-antitoxin system